MEKASLGSKRPKGPSHWGHSSDTDSVDTGHAEYLTRLTSLRDSLIKQEQLYLARAIDRLRMQSVSNKSSSNRLRSNLRDVKKSTPSAPRASMLTTVEKFRQMRPRAPKPEIHPLVGKQLLVGHVTATSSSVDLLVCPEVDPDDAATRRTSQTTLSKDDDIVESNLLRLSQATCSIPNIGRKARTSQESLEPKTKSLQSLRSTLCRQKGRLFLPFQNTKSLSSPLPSCNSPDISTGNLQSQRSSAITFPIIYSRDAWKNDVYYTDLGINEEEDAFSNLIVNSRSESKEHRKNVENTENCRTSDKGYVDRPQVFCKTRLRNGQRILFSQHTLRKRKEMEFVSSNGNAFHSYKNTPTVYHGNRNMPDLGRSVKEYIHGVIQLLPDKSYRASIKNGIVYIHGIEDEPVVETLDCVDTGASDMAQSENDTSLLQRTSHNLATAASASTVNVHTIPATSVKHENKLLMNFKIDSKQEKDLRLDTNAENHLCEMSQYVDGNKTHKKHIIVDMPKIIFNAASPSHEWDDESIEEDPNESQQSNLTQSPLRKVVQQQQVRIKELTNLLEDVKELSMKTETLKLQSAI